MRCRPLSAGPSFNLQKRADYRANSRSRKRRGGLSNAGLFRHILVDVHIRVAGENRAPALQECAHHRIAGELLPVELERGVGLVLDLDQKLSWFVDVLQQTDAGP